MKPNSLLVVLWATTLFANSRAQAGIHPVTSTNDAPAPAAAAAEPGTNVARLLAHSPDGYCTITIDASKEPSLREWADQKLAPVLAEWYPKLTGMLASDGFTPPKAFKVVLRRGGTAGYCAITDGTRITANSAWLKSELNGEAVGCLLHEEIHVVQQYGAGPRRPPARSTPGWLVEGIPDYIRWFLYEPQSHGADAAYFARLSNPKLNYDGLYRVSANFLNYVFQHYDHGAHLLTKLNAVCRQGKYRDAFWKEHTGKTLEELNTEWKEALQKEMASLPKRGRR